MIAIALLLLALPQEGKPVQSPPVLEAPHGLAAEWEAFRTEWGSASNAYNEKVQEATRAERVTNDRAWIAQLRALIERARAFRLRAEGDPIEPEVARWIWMQQFNLLQKEERLEFDELQRRIDESKPEDVAALRGEWRKGESRSFAEALALVETIPQPANERQPDYGAHVLAWILQRGEDLPEAQTALEKLRLRHATDRELADTCAMLVNRNGAHVARWLGGFADQPWGQATRGSALHALALQEANAASMLRHLRERDEIAGNLRKFLDPAFIRELETRDPAALEQSAIERLERVCKEFPEVTNYRGKLGDLARAKLHEMRDLAIGAIAPEIAGSDVEGVAFKLGDYRGKVVLLDFWGNW